MVHFIAKVTLQFFFHPTTGYDTRGVNTNFQPSSSTQSGYAQNMVRGTNTDFLPYSSTQTQQAQNISMGINTNMGVNTQEEQCHSSDFKQTEKRG